MTLGLPDFAFIRYSLSTIMHMENFPEEEATGSGDRWNGCSLTEENEDVIKHSPSLSDGAFVMPVQSIEVSVNQLTILLFSNSNVYCTYSTPGIERGADILNKNMAAT